jgi:hypothetical protein
MRPSAGASRIRSVILALATAGLACGQTPPVPPAALPPFLPESRVLSITASPRLDPPPTPLDFLAGFELAYQAGARGAYISYTWSGLEPAPGSFELASLKNDLDYAALVRGLAVEINLQILNTTAKETPADLAGTSFDDPEMLPRFRALFDAIRPLLDSHVRYLAIGNEVDIYLETHPEQWEPYQSFYREAAAYVRQQAPWLQIGVAATFAGASGPAANHVAELNSVSDVWILTYYPLEGKFQAENPNAPEADFPAMVDRAGGKPVVLQEVGYPSAERLGSSEAEQAEFVASVFRAWQATGEAIPFLNYFLLHDFTGAMCDEMLVYYGFKDEDFKAYLCTIGLRQADGTAKAGWEAFREAARSAGFPVDG